MSDPEQDQTWDPENWAKWLAYLRVRDRRLRRITGPISGGELVSRGEELAARTVALYGAAGAKVILETALKALKRRGRPRREDDLNHVIDEQEYVFLYYAFGGSVSAAATQYMTNHKLKEESMRGAVEQRIDRAISSVRDDIKKALD